MQLGEFGGAGWIHGPGDSAAACANICSLTSEGHAYARFRRALENGNGLAALAAARELAHLGLSDALELCLALRGDPRRFESAVARWHARYVLETRGVSLVESQAVLALLGALRGPRASEACHALADLLVGRRGLDRAGEALVRAAMLRGDAAGGEPARGAEARRTS